MAYITRKKQKNVRATKRKYTSKRYLRGGTSASNISEMFINGDKILTLLRKTLKEAFANIPALHQRIAALKEEKERLAGLLHQDTTGNHTDAISGSKTLVVKHEEAVALLLTTFQESIQAIKETILTSEIDKQINAEYINSFLHILEKLDNEYSDVDYTNFKYMIYNLFITQDLIQKSDYYMEIYNRHVLPNDLDDTEFNKRIKQIIPLLKPSEGKDEKDIQNRFQGVVCILHMIRNRIYNKKVKGFTDLPRLETGIPINKIISYKTLEETIKKFDTSLEKLIDQITRATNNAEVLATLNSLLQYCTGQPTTDGPTGLERTAPFPTKGRTTNNIERDDAVVTQSANSTSMFNSMGKAVSGAYDSAEGLTSSAASRLQGMASGLYDSAASGFIPYSKGTKPPSRYPSIKNDEDSPPTSAETELKPPEKSEEPSVLSRTGTPLNAFSGVGKSAYNAATSLGSSVASDLTSSAASGYSSLRDSFGSLGSLGSLSPWGTGTQNPENTNAVEVEKSGGGRSKHFTRRRMNKSKSSIKYNTTLK